MIKNIEKRIMIVDDDPDILISFREIFEREGYEVFTVDSGMDCIKELEYGFKGLILIDLMMPFMDGWQTIEEIKNKGFIKNVVISIITAKWTTDQEKLRSLQPYIYDYITKPFDIQKLITKVNNIINS